MVAWDIRADVNLQLGRLEEAKRAGQSVVDLGRQLGRQRFVATELDHIDPAFVGPMALAGLALATDDADRRDWALTRGREILAAGAPCHGHLHFYQDGFGATYLAGDDHRASALLDGLASHCRAEPHRFGQAIIARGRYLLATRAGEARPDELESLRATLRTMGMHPALTLLSTPA